MEYTARIDKLPQKEAAVRGFMNGLEKCKQGLLVPCAGVLSKGPPKRIVLCLVVLPKTGRVGGQKREW